MFIKNIKDVPRFLQVVSQCRGKVELLTKEGDILNLKSKLCQYIALSSIFSEAKIHDIEIVVHDPDDLSLLSDYLVRG